MKLERNLHSSDVLELNETDLEDLSKGHILQTGALVIKKVKKPQVSFFNASPDKLVFYPERISSANLVLTFCPNTNKLLSAEVLK